MAVGLHHYGEARTCSFVRIFSGLFEALSTLSSQRVGVAWAVCLSFFIAGCGSGGGNSQGASPQSSPSVIHAQKGPFQSGSQVILYELDASGQRTGRTTVTSITGIGEFVADTPWSGATEVEVTGPYFDESNGTFSVQPGTLTAWINLPSTETQYVNLFTHCALARTRRLVADGQPVDIARVTAFNELRALFNLQTDDPEALVYLDLSDGTGPLSADNANLLLLSTALMAAGLQQDAIDNLCVDIADDGIINGVAMPPWIRASVTAGVVDLSLAKTYLETLPGVPEAPDFTTLGSTFPAWVDLAGDADSDGLSDPEEVLVEGSDPLSSDTDADGMPDGWEVSFGFNPLADDATDDPDGDGLTNAQEYLNLTDPRADDTDGDTYTDGYEISNGGDPLDALGLPLVITSSPDLVTETGFDYSYSVATTWSGVSLSLDNAPPGMTIDTLSGSLVWTPSLAQLGNFSITVRVTSGIYSNTQSYVLSTTPGNTGDVNEDGTVNGKDILLSERISLGLMTPTTAQMTRADVIADGSIQGDDIIKIQRMALGL